MGNAPELGCPVNSLWTPHSFTGGAVEFPHSWMIHRDKKQRFPFAPQPQAVVSVPPGTGGEGGPAGLSGASWK